MLGRTAKNECEGRVVYIAGPLIYHEAGCRYTESLGESVPNSRESIYFSLTLLVKAIFTRKTRASSDLNFWLHTSSLIRFNLDQSMFARPLPQVLVTSLALAATSHAVPALEQRANSAVWTWAHDAAQCKTDVCTSDCQSAAAQVCAMPDLSTTQSVTVGGCTAFYWYDTGNTLPSAKDCNAAFTTITGPASKAGSAGDCPGYVGGASGYGADGKRTNDPLYMISPSTGNGNCLKAPGDTSSVLAKDELPNGKSLSTCPTSSSRRKRAASTEASLEERDTKCPLEELFVGSGCSGTCLVSVTAAGWE